jgi:hypothetical protein
MEISLTSDDQAKELKELVTDCLKSSHYGKLQWLLNHGQLTPQQFKELNILDDDYFKTCNNQALDVHWLLDHIYPELTETGDHSSLQYCDQLFVTYLICYGDSTLEAALSRGFTLDKVSPSIWISMIVWISDIGTGRFSMRVVDKLFALNIPFPDNNYNSVGWTTHTTIGMVLFIEYRYFIQALKRGLIVHFSRDEDRATLRPGINQFSERKSLNLLFRLGFTKEDLCQSTLFRTIIHQCSPLIDDWIAQDVGYPVIIGDLDDFCHRIVTQSNTYWRKVAGYLMETYLNTKTRSNKSIGAKHLWHSKKLIKLSIRLDYMCILEWEYIASLDNNKYPRLKTVNIQEALGSLLRTTKKT